MHVECAGFPIALRPEQPGDRQFVARLFASAREQELEVTGWSEEVKGTFCTQQFQAQTLHYARAFPDADRQIVLVNGDQGGRLYLLRRSTNLRIIEIALLREYQGSGIGTALLRTILEEAHREGRDVSLRVALHSPARRLYARLGFEEISNDGVYLSMCRATVSLQSAAVNG